MKKEKPVTVPNENIFVCHYCGNRVPMEFVAAHRGQKLYEQVEAKKYFQDFDVSVYQCPTCNGVSVFADFTKYPRHDSIAARRIYPPGAKLVPDPHKVASKDCVPSHIQTLYEEIAPLRYIAPNAFAGQIRRALEFISQEQKAKGRTLFEQLRDLTSRGAFPGHFADVTDLMRTVGNLGAHATDRDVDMWEAELLDDFFLAIIEYVYVTPSKIERLRRRLGSRKA
jgi:hypothetical protein